MDYVEGTEPVPELSYQEAKRSRIVWRREGEGGGRRFGDMFVSVFGRGRTRRKGEKFAAVGFHFGMGDASPGLAEGGGAGDIILLLLN